MKPVRIALLATGLGLVATTGMGQLGGNRTGDHRRGGITDDVLVASLLDEIEASTATQARLAGEVDALADKQTATRARLTRNVQALYRLTRAGRAPLSGGFDALRMHVARLARLKRLVRVDKGDLIALDEALGRSRERKANLDGRLANARGRLTSVQEQYGLASRPGGPMDVFAQPPKAPSAAFSQASHYGFRFSEPGPQSSFEQLKGALASPVSGEVRVVPARRQESDGPGLEFQATAGTPVRAVASGRVAFSDHYGSYGRLVILDHGDSYYTVYGGLGAIEVRVGDDVSKRARLGSIGSAAITSALFFEVRKGTRTLEPRGWLGI